MDLGPFDAINVGAGAWTVPLELVSQLKPGGALLVPVGGLQSSQTMRLITKAPCRAGSPDRWREGEEGFELEERVVFRPVRFVPLVEQPPEQGG